MTPEVSFKEFYHQRMVFARDQALIESERIRLGGKPWDKYNSGILEYESYFSNLLGKDTFFSFLGRRRLLKGKTFILDVMGTGGYPAQYPIDGEVAMTLIDPRSSEEKEHDSKNGKVLLAGQPSEDDSTVDMSGNILQNTPWLEAQRYITTHDDTAFPGFDLITCRPEFGWAILDGQTIENYHRRNQNPVSKNTMLWILIQKMYSLLSTNGGTLVMQMPSVGYSQWYEELKGIQGIDVKKVEWNDMYEGAPHVKNPRLSLKITKGDNPPKLLPSSL